MRAYRIDSFGSVDGVVLASRDDPRPGTRDILVRVHATSLNYRDLMVGSTARRTGRSAPRHATPVGPQLTNASAILWRLETLGYHIGDRWRDLAALWEGHADGKCLVFTDIHAAMAELGSGQEAAVERRLAAMRETAASGAEASDLYRTVGIPVVAGLAAFHRGAYDRAVELLLQVRFDLWQIGGSHAQRDVVNWTLTEAAIRAGQRDVALSFAHERLGTRPRSAPNQRFLRLAEDIAGW
jgi:hypothetical protein